MMHRFSDIVVIDSCEEDNVEFYSQGSYVENMFDRVFDDLNDSKGVCLKDRVKFKNSYLNVIEKCNIENSMDVIYKLLNKHISPQETTYFSDDEEVLPSEDILKVLEFMRHLHRKKIPKRFVGGFLILMVKLVYFPLSEPQRTYAKI